MVNFPTHEACPPSVNPQSAESPPKTCTPRMGCCDSIVSPQKQFTPLEPPSHDSHPLELSVDSPAHSTYIPDPLSSPQPLNDSASPPLAISTSAELPSTFSLPISDTTSSISSQHLPTPLPSNLAAYDPAGIQNNLFVDLHVPQVPQPTVSSPPNAHPMITRRKLQQNPQLASQLALLASTHEPRSLKTALRDTSWFQAMQDEIYALHANQTWVLVPRPPHANVVGSKWVYRTKYKEDGSIDRLKARLVARGYTQVEGEDFDETFSPVIRHTTIRVVISIAVTNNWLIRQLDVKNAFLHGTLKELVYMEQPPGFTSSTQPDHVCLLKKSLHGLKQAPRAWFDRLSQFLLSLGFLCSKADPSLFILHHGHTIILLLIYVDDLLLTGNNPTRIDELVIQLGTEFSLKDLGRLHYFLGIEARYFPGGMYLSQSKYTCDLLHRAKMLHASHMNTPLAVKATSTPNDQTPVDTTEYRRLVGSLQYLTFTRPDICHAVSRACQHFQNPTSAHLRDVKRILRYLKGTVSFGLRITRQSSLNLTGFSDADWAGCPITRRSTSGHCIFLGANCVSWSSKKQPTVSRSSTEAEYRAMASATAEITWISFLLRDIGVVLLRPPHLLCDNISALHMTINPVLHGRTKHIEIDYHFVREKVAIGQLVTRHLPSRLQIADILTKPHSGDLFRQFTTKLGIQSLPLPSLRGHDDTPQLVNNEGLTKAQKSVNNEGLTKSSN